jgi:hypothetical protein
MELMMSKTIPSLTAKEAKALDTAVAAILSRLALAKGASLTISLQNYHGEPGQDLTFFTVGGEQLSSYRTRELIGGSASEKMNAAIALQNTETSDQDELRARRVQRLRDELAALEAAPADQSAAA